LCIARNAVGKLFAHPKNFRSQDRRHSLASPCWQYVEATDAQSAWDILTVKEATDPDVGTVNLHHEKRLAGTVKKYCAVIPLTNEVGDVIDTFAA
jgi:hypothetical protein